MPNPSDRLTDRLVMSALYEALKPFADLAGKFPEGLAGHVDGVVSWSNSTGRSRFAGSAKVADFRRAAEAIALAEKHTQND